MPTPSYQAQIVNLIFKKVEMVVVIEAPLDQHNLVWREALKLTQPVQHIKVYNSKTNFSLNKKLQLIMIMITPYNSCLMIIHNLHLLLNRNNRSSNRLIYWTNWTI